MTYEGDNAKCPMHGVNKIVDRFTPIEFLIGFWVVVIGLCATLVFVLMH